MTTIYHANSDFEFEINKNIGTQTNLKLISLGTRTKYMLVIYGVGLYSYPEVNKFSEIYNDDTIKCLTLKFYRSTDYENIYKSFIEIIEKRIKLSNISKELEQMYNTFKIIKNIKYTDQIDMIWYLNKLEIQYNKQVLSIIDNKEFAKIIFDCYLDENSVTPDLLNLAL